MESLFSVLMATTGSGIERATQVDGAWETTPVLPEHDVRCLAADGAGSVLAGTQARGYGAPTTAASSGRLRGSIDGS